MTEGQRFVSVGEMEAMSPQQRAEVVAAHTERSWDELPAGFSARVDETAAQLAARLPKRA